MADITYRRVGELLRGLFEVLMAEPEGLPGREAMKATEQKVTPTPFELTFLPKGERRYESIIHWHTVDCVKAGWLAKAHGRWSITDEGRNAFATIRDPEAFYRRAFELYSDWRKGIPKTPSEPSPVTSPVTEALVENDSAKRVSVTFDQADGDAWDEIENHLANMDPYDFQDLVAALLKAMGYFIEWIAPKGKDGGFDIIAFNDPLGTRPPRIKVQVKRQQQKVAVDGLRSFMAILGSEDAGIFVNTGGFTPDAKNEARAQNSRRVTLVDMERLVELWIEHYSELEEVERRRLPLQPIYFLAPEI